MTAHHNPLYVAKGAQHMAKAAGAGEGVVFQRVATVSMCMVAVLTGMHMLMEIWRELRRDEHQKSRGR